MPKLTLKVDARSAVKAHTDLAKAQKEVAKQADVTEKKLTKQERAARRIQEAVDPTKRYNRAIKETATLVQKNAIGLDTAKKRAEQLNTRLERTGQTGKRAFGSAGLAQLRNYAAGIVAVTAVVALLKKGFQEAEAASQSAADNVFRSIGAQGELQQLDPAKLAKLNQRAKGFISQGLFLPEQRALAFETAFLLESSGFKENEVGQLAQLGASGLVRGEDLQGIGSKLRKVQTLLGIANFEQTVDKVIAASGSTAASFSQVAAAIPTFAGEAKALGFSPDETLGAFVAIEQGAKDVEIAKVQFRSLLGRIDKSELNVNNDITDTIAAIQVRIDNGEKLSDIIPDIRGRTAARALLSSQAVVEQVEQDVANSAGLAVERGGGLAAIDPVFGAAQARRRSGGVLAQLREDKFAEQELLLQTIKSSTQASFENQGQRFMSSMAGLGIDFLDIIGAERFAINQLAGDPNNSVIGDSQTQDQILDFLRRTADATEAINTQTPIEPRRE